MEKYTLKEWIKDNKIRIGFFNSPNQVVKIPMPILIYAALGEGVTFKKFEKIFMDHSLRNRSNTVLSLSFKKNEYLSFQNVTEHGTGRDCYIFYPNGKISFVDGKTYKPKNGRNNKNI